MDLKKIMLERRELAKDRNTSKDVLRQLAKGNNHYIVRMCVAKNPTTPLDTLRYLIKDKDSEVRAGILVNPSTSPAILGELAKDDVWFIRRDVAQNPNTPVEALLDLATDEEMDVRRALVTNRNISADILIKLFDYEKSLNHPDIWTIRALYTHKNLPYVAKVIIETLFGNRLL